MCNSLFRGCVTAENNQAKATNAHEPIFADTSAAFDWPRSTGIYNGVLPLRLAAVGATCGRYGRRYSCATARTCRTAKYGIFLSGAAGPFVL